MMSKIVHEDHEASSCGNVPLVIGFFATLLQEDELRTAADLKKLIDLAAVHSHYNLLHLTMRNRQRQMTDPEVHDWWKNVVIYAKSKGFKTILDLDIRHSIPEFMKRYPGDFQQRLLLREFPLNTEGSIETDIVYEQNHGDAICNPAPIDIQLAKAYSYEKSPDGIIPESIEDITGICISKSFSYLNPAVDNPRLNKEVQRLSCIIPAAGNGSRRMVCLIAVATLAYPDVFSENYLSFESDVVRQYADLPLDGIMKDECGLPVLHDGNPRKNSLWFSPERADGYAKRTDGRDLLRDSILMCFGERGREGERQGAVNHYMNMVRVRMTEIGRNCYRDGKETFGQDAFIGSHETVIPYPDPREFERNGLNWWTAQRDFAQSDETTPYCCRTSMAKKFDSVIWYNQWYAPSADLYEKPLWSYALAGGRMNFHMLHPDWSNKLSILERYTSLMRGDLQKADCRICLLNYITETSLDCPVAVIFGHPAAMNWASSTYEDVGMGLSDAFWKAGYYADLIPSSEFAEGVLRIGDDGFIHFGKQRYSAVVLYHPEFENPAVAEFFRAAANGGTFLAYMGAWKKDFDGNPFDGKTNLPKNMILFNDITTCADATIAELKKRRIDPQTPATVTFPKWVGMGGTSMALPSKGRSRLIDGTVLLIAGEDCVHGDPIRETVEVKGHAVRFDAVGVAAVRLNDSGELVAMAAGGLKSFQGGGININLDTRIDLAIWKDKAGKWQGVLQDYEGPLSEDLKALGADWSRLSVPKSFDE
ncbi:MAG: hypothetical protein WCI51_14835 [Lentisphaerota bacterium]